MRNLQILLLIIFSITIFNCSSDDSETNQEDVSFNSADYIYFVSGKINGESFIYGQKVDDTSLNYTLIADIPSEASTCAFSVDQGLDLKLSYGASVYPASLNGGSQSQVSFYFLRFYRCSDPQSSTEVFNDLFTVGNYDYSANDSDAGIMRQIGVNYSPVASEDNYYESYGASQSGNMFRITNTEENNAFLLGNLVEQTQIVEGEFSVSLSSVNDSSDIVEITDGRFKIILTR